MEFSSVEKNRSKLSELRSQACLGQKHAVYHRVGRVLSFFSSRRNWDSPNPSPAGKCAPPFGTGGWGTLAGERGGGRVPIPTRVLCIYMYFVLSILFAGAGFFVKLIFFMPFSSVPSLGIDSSVGMPRNEHFLPRNNGSHSESIPRNFSGTKFRCQP